MKRTFLVTLTSLTAFAVTPAVAQTPSFPLVQTVGSGNNESFFVLDFEDGAADQSYGFGYRYNQPTGGTPLSGLDMVNALINANIGLTDTVTVYPFGTAIDSFNYRGHSEGSFQTSGYWSYWLSQDGQSWTNAPVGAGDRPLSNGSYDGWAWDVNSQVVAGPITPRATSAVPEPDAAWLLLAGLPAVLVARRRTKK